MNDKRRLPAAVLKSVEAVIFDLDGLVLDTEITYFQAWQQAARTMGFLLPDRFCESLSGLSYREVEARMLDYCGSLLDLEAFARLSGECWYRNVTANGIAIKKGFHALHRVLLETGMRFCLATNSGSVNAFECLQFAGLDTVFELVVARDHVARGKPAPDIFLTAAERLSVPIACCLALEDSPTGVSAASAAGAISVYIPSLVPADRYALEICDWLCDDLDDVALVLSDMT
ncbi:MAG: HAD family phosphatase [Methylomicrobium sp.]